jgi:peptidoglycan/LPS O-acetylase OafA/YrhL
MLQRAGDASPAGWANDAGHRFNNFDFLRFALAGAVVLSHSFALLGKREPFSSVSNEQIDLGKFAVDSFFVISGFLITQSWLRSRSGWDYFRKRVVRIYPAFAAAVVFGAVVVPWLAPLPPHARPIMSSTDYARMTGHILNLQGYEPGNVFPTNRGPTINGSLWSIRYEFWCYVGVAVAAWIGCVRRPRWLLAVFAGAVVVSVLFLVFGWTPGGKILGKVFGYPPFWARMLPYYLAGMVFYLFRAAIPCNAWLALVAAAGLVVGAFVPCGMAVALPTAGTYLLFYLAFRPVRPLANWAKWGDFSYGMYLYAFPIQQLMIAHWGRELSPLKLFAWALPASVVAGVVSWYGVEKWFLRLKRRKPKAPTVTPAEDTAVVVAT